MPDVTVTPLSNGPYLIVGPITLIDPEGRALAVAGEKVALCRCGASATKPFCDGTHVKIGFRDKEEAT